MNDEAKARIVTRSSQQNCKTKRIQLSSRQKRHSNTINGKCTVCLSQLNSLGVLLVHSKVSSLNSHHDVVAVGVFEGNSEGYPVGNNLPLATAARSINQQPTFEPAPPGTPTVVNPDAPSGTVEVPPGTTFVPAAPGTPPAFVQASPSTASQEAPAAATAPGEDVDAEYEPALQPEIAAPAEVRPEDNCLNDEDNVRTLRCCYRSVLFLRIIPKKCKFFYLTK